jgi:uncharacterized protein (DUF488 family)
MAKPTVFTIGHSTRSFDELVEVLAAHGVAQLVDIRSIRRSRTNPQFNEATLPRRLQRRGIRYVALPALGGRRPKAPERPRKSNAAWQHSAFRNYADYALTAPFRAGIAELLALAREAPSAIMCSEAPWWRCHRRIVADHLLARGVPVVHLMTRTRGEPATPTPFAVIGRGTVHYPTASRGRAKPARSPSSGRAPGRRASAARASSP